MLAQLSAHRIKRIDIEAFLERAEVRVTVNVPELGVVRLQVLDLCIGALLAPLPVLIAGTIWCTHTMCTLVRSSNVSERYAQFIKRRSPLSINLICV